STMTTNALPNRCAALRSMVVTLVGPHSGTQRGSTDVSGVDIRLPEDRVVVSAPRHLSRGKRLACAENGAGRCDGSAGPVRRAYRAARRVGRSGVAGMAEAARRIGRGTASRPHVLRTLDP